MRRFSALACLVLGFLVTASSCAKLDLFKRSEPTLTPSPRAGNPAPEIEGEDFDGVHFKLSDYRGKVVVVSFWASWCPHCIKMMPHERALVERFGDQFVMLSVNNDANRNAAAKVIASHDVTWRNWWIAGCDNPTTRRWGVDSWPRVYVIDPAGVIRYANVSGPYLETAVTTLLKEAEKKR